MPRPTDPPWQTTAPAVEKDYMYENVRRIRAVSSQHKKARQQPMKATFVPGVTKNTKYDHVTSRLTGIIHGMNGRDRADEDIPLTKSRSHTGISTTSAQLNFLPDKFNPILNGNLKKIESLSQSSKSAKPIWGASETANALRLSRSTTDLSQKNKTHENREVSFKTPPRRKKSEPLKPHEESVYNWRFSDVNHAPSNDHFETDKFGQFKDAKNIHYHKVEYLPCDGICAEENIPAGYGDTNGDSGRSSNSSSRTSRGVNTDETRIFLDGNRGLRRVKSLDRIEDQPDHFAEPAKQKSAFTLKNSTGTGTETTYEEPRPQLQTYPFNGKSDAQMNRIRNELSSLKVKDNSNQPTTVRSNVGLAGDAPHLLGEVPKYLKQRQQEWKYEAAAKKEAEKNRDIPPGHFLMSENERVETLNTLKRNYDSLVEELNRIPIRMDTIRVRDQKIKLENQFAKLEQAMRVFSRPRVFVKMDQ